MSVANVESAVRLVTQTAQQHGRRRGNVTDMRYTRVDPIL